MKPSICIAAVLAAATLALSAAADEPAPSPPPAPSAQIQPAAAPPGQAAAAAQPSPVAPPQGFVSAQVGVNQVGVNGAGVNGAATGAGTNEPPAAVFHPKEKLGGQKLIGALVGATGFITLAIGAFLVVSSNTLYNDAKGRCSSGCSQTEVDDSLHARTRANTGGIIGVVGLALAGGGIALYLTAPDKPADAGAPKDGAPKDGAPPPAARAPSHIRIGLAPSLGGLFAVGFF